MRRLYGIVALGLVVLGLLNLAAGRTGSTDAFVAYATSGVNALGVGIALWAIPTVGGPPPYLLLFLFGAALLGSLARRSASQ